MLAFLESDGELINSAPAKRSQSLSVGSTSSDAAVEDAADDALRSESRRSHAELGDCGLDSSVAHEEAAMPGAIHREGKHGLALCTIPKATHICDLCKTLFALGAPVSRCARCDYDVCPGCVAAAAVEL